MNKQNLIEKIRLIDKQKVHVDHYGHHINTK